MYALCIRSCFYFFILLNPEMNYRYHEYFVYLCVIEEIIFLGIR